MTNKKILILVSLLLVSFLLISCIPSVPPINQAPVIDSVPIVTATVGIIYTYNVNATDPDSDTLTYSLTTYPSDMTIDSATGVISWVPISAQVGDNSVVVKVFDGALSDTQGFTITVRELKIELTGIEVDPKTMILFAGESEAIKSVTATFEIRGYEVPIALGNCTYASSATNVATTSNGVVTAIAEGIATITVGYEGKTDTLEVEVTVSAIVYRALCVGVGDYQNYGPDTGDLLGPPYDVDRMIDVFNYCKFGTDEVVFSTPVSLKDLNATKTAIISGIASTFSGADYNDISYFYFSGHGSYTGVFATSYICPTDFDGSVGSAISIDELESYLSSIPGTKVVILDSCFSGGFIGKEKEEIIISKEELISFNDEIINVFSQAEYKGLLTTNQYKVLTSCHYYQGCIELYPTVPGTFDPFGVFTMGLCEGCAYYGSYPADINLDTKVSLQEAYLYVRNWVAALDAQIPDIDITQDIQVYPYNSTYPIVEY